MPYESTDDDLRELFEPFGELEFARVVVDFLIIFLVTITVAVAGILFLVPPEGGSGVGEGL